jgi:ATP-dependent Clp protease ATP-binding subunit ClpA
MTNMIVDELGRIPMSPYLTATLTRAADYATAQAHREVTLEHLLLALVEDPEASVVLKSSNVQLARLTTEVSDFLGHSVDRVDPSEGHPVTVSQDLKRILEAAAAAAQPGRRREINGAIVLAAIVGDGKSTAAHLLRNQGLTFEEAIRALQKATAAPPPPRPAEASDGHPASTEEVLASARERINARTGGDGASSAALGANREA